MLKFYSQNLCVKLFMCFALFITESCINNDYREQEENQAAIKSGIMYKDLKLSLKQHKSAWKGNKVFDAKAEIKQMQLLFDIDFGGVNKSLLPVSENKKDTFSETIFNIEILFNGKPIVFEMADPDKSWLRKNALIKCADSALTFQSDPVNLLIYKHFQLSLPVYVFSNLKANAAGTITVRMWQDCFIGNEKTKARKPGINDQEKIFYRDTLQTKLIDNTYSFAFTVPEMYRTDIICDSIILQDDESWSPNQSDHTLWKSSYPDIYFSLSDLFGATQSSSETQKSTSKYTIGDTLSFYHYSPNELFAITVFDYDALSKDDWLGEWSGYLRSLKNNSKLDLEFGRIRHFYLHKKEFGKIN